jgi:hypothetical protein
MPAAARAGLLNQRTIGLQSLVTPKILPSGVLAPPHSPSKKSSGCDWLSGLLSKSVRSSNWPLSTNLPMYSSLT